MEKVKSCGFLIYRCHPKPSFLLMRHTKRWDLPKGHVDGDETNMQCALRELEEETGIQVEDLKIDDEFKYKDKYVVQYKSGKPKKKKLIIFLAELIQPVDIVVTEHLGFEWFDWDPPHKIQNKTIDPVLDHVAQHWKKKFGTPMPGESARLNNA